MNKLSWLIVFGILFALLATATVLLNMPPLTDCRSEAPVVGKEYGFRATQTVVQPWQGQHHVYGTFSVPDQYRRDRLYRAKLMIQGFSQEFAEVSPEGGDNYNGRAEPGHYEKRVYLPTRTALWFLVTGQFGDLKMPCHWWLVIADRVTYRPIQFMPDIQPVLASTTMNRTLVDHYR
jgi:hypothetical protein